MNTFGSHWSPNSTVVGQVRQQHPEEEQHVDDHDQREAHQVRPQVGDLCAARGPAPCRRQEWSRWLRRSARRTSMPVPPLAVTDRAAFERHEPALRTLRSGLCTATPTTVDEYLAALPDDRRAQLEPVYRTVRDAMPDGFAETMAWGMITWSIPLADFPDTYNGQPLCYVALGGPEAEELALPDGPVRRQRRGRGLPGPLDRRRHPARHGQELRPVPDPGRRTAPAGRRRQSPPRPPTTSSRCTSGPAPNAARGPCRAACRDPRRWRPCRRPARSVQRSTSEPNTW